MATFEWSTDLETGHSVIDEQHRGLFALANRLEECLACGADEPELVSDAIYRLNDYVIEHFADEEALMTQTGYPRASTHRSEHESLSADTMRLMAAYFNGESIAAARIAPFVTSWLQNHIRDEDMRFVRYLGDARPAGE